MQYKKISELMRGDVAAMPVKLGNGATAIGANIEMGRGYAERLCNMDVEGVYVLDNEACYYENKLKDGLANLGARAGKDRDVLRYAANAVLAGTMYVPGSPCDPDVVYNFDACTKDHAVGTACLSVMMGIAGGLDGNALDDLAMGSILHDAGKSRVDPGILNKPGKLDGIEFEAMRRHPEYGWEAYHDRISDGALDVVLRHHECGDGSGYPGGLKSGGIPMLAELVHAADVWDALTRERPYKPAFLPEKARKILLEDVAAGKIAGWAADLLFRCVEPYPAGMGVVLSDGTRGRVARRGDDVFRPVVRSHAGRVVRLDREPDISVVAMGPEHA